MDYIEVQAGVRFWEDAEVNGVEDTNGDLIPLREGDYWCPVIRIRDGAVMGWPQGVRASIHYKVCDEGQYWLLDCNRRRVSKYKGYYVPAVLSPSADPDGDYIVMEIDDNGMISEWDPDALDVSGWEPCDA